MNSQKCCSLAPLHQTRFCNHSCVTRKIVFFVMKSQKIDELGINANKEIKFLSCRKRHAQDLFGLLIYQS